MRFSFVVFYQVSLLVRSMTDKDKHLSLTTFSPTFSGDQHLVLFFPGANYKPVSTNCQTGLVITTEVSLDYTDFGSCYLGEFYCKTFEIFSNTNTITLYEDV